MNNAKYTKVKAGKKVNGVFGVLAWDGCMWSEIGKMVATKDRPRGIYYPEVVVEYEITMNDGEFILETVWTLDSYKPAQTSAQAKKEALKAALTHANESSI